MVGFSEDMVPESTMMTGVFCYRWPLYCLSNEGLTHGKSGHVCRTLETWGPWPLNLLLLLYIHYQSLLTLRLRLFIHLLSFEGSQGGWSLSQPTPGEGQGTPRTSGQFITGLTFRDNQSHSHSHLQGIWSHQLTKPCISLNCGRKSGYHEGTHADVTDSIAGVTALPSGDNLDSNACTCLHEFAVGLDQHQSGSCWHSQPRHRGELAVTSHIACGRQRLNADGCK